jgi:hypothetical protein
MPSFDADAPICESRTGRSDEAGRGKGRRVLSERGGSSGGGSLKAKEVQSGSDGDGDGSGDDDGDGEAKTAKAIARKLLQAG